MEITISYRHSVNSAKASIEAEGFNVTEKQMELVEKKVKGGMCHDTFIRRARQLAKEK